MLALKIIGALAAVGLGVWLGLPGRYEQSLDEVERNMVLGTGKSHKVKRVFTPLAWLQRKLSPRGSEPKRRRAFSLEHPDER
jgi:hypothetical protein